MAKPLSCAGASLPVCVVDACAALYGIKPAVSYGTAYLFRSTALPGRSRRLLRPCAHFVLPTRAPDGQHPKTAPVVGTLGAIPMIANSIIHGDCTRVMPTLPADCADFILTDPP